MLLTQVGAAPASTLATSASGRWQLSRAEAGAVTLTPLPDSHARKAPPQATFSNPRYTFWADEYQTWEVSRAAFSPRSQYAIVQWSDSVPKYTSSELDVITLDGYQRRTLPMSDLRNSLAMPIWSNDEKYLAASGGNSVRLWTLGDPRFNDPITVRLLARPAATGLDVGFAQVLGFSQDGRQLKVSYGLYQASGHPDPKRQLRAVYRVSDGQLLSFGVEPAR